MSLAVGSHLTRRFTRRRCAPHVIVAPLGRPYERLGERWESSRAHFERSTEVECWMSRPTRVAS
jgi:hypothetical protein